MTTDDNGFATLVAHKFYCKHCDYITSRNSSFNKHILTRKHKKVANNNALATFDNGLVAKVAKHHKCQHCDKNYKDRAGLWRHKKKCVPIVEEKPEINTELVMQLLKQNQELQNTIIDMAGKINTTNITNNNNNQFNINLFLNEKCKDAMNITEFIKTIKLTFDDLLNTEKLGYVKGISSIIVNGLRQLDVCKRPIHCSDVKRETIYVKSHDDKWEKDDEDKNKIKELIRDVSSKNSKQILPWADATEGTNDGTHKNGHLFMRVAVAANGGSEEELNKVVTLLAPKIAIDKNST